MINGVEAGSSMSIQVLSEDDVYQAVCAANYLIRGCSFDEAAKQCIFISLIEVTKNVLDHGGGYGYCRCEMTHEGFRFTCVDKGCGIPNLDEVLQGTCKLSRGLGLGLASVKRLMDELEISTSAEGTKIIALKRERR